MSWAEKLGCGAHERLVVVHVDDIGMCDDANRGALEALDGLATCGSAMVPCPAFENIAEVARRRPELDLGVHLTLNAEYEGYRWGPLRGDVDGLRSPDGGMWRALEETVAHASAAEVERELCAQIDRAIAAGIDVTHLDSHMGTVLHPKFVEVYARLGRRYRLPLFAPRVDPAVLAGRGMREGMALYLRVLEDLERDGFPIFDHFDADSLEFPPGTGVAHNRRRLERLGPGLSYLITHAAHGGPELASISGDWRQRDEERRIYSDGSMAEVLAAEGVRTIGMRPLRDLLRGVPGAPLTPPPA